MFTVSGLKKKSRASIVTFAAARAVISSSLDAAVVAMATAAPTTATAAARRTAFTGVLISPRPLPRSRPSCIPCAPPVRALTEARRRLWVEADMSRNAQLVRGPRRKIPDFVRSREGLPDWVPCRQIPIDVAYAAPAVTQQIKVAALWATRGGCVAHNFDADDPVYRIHCWRYSCPSIEGQSVRIPANARPAQGTDRHLTIVDRAGGYLWDLYKMETAGPSGGSVTNWNKLRSPTGGVLYIGSGGRERIDGDGRGIAGDGANAAKTGLL